MSSVTRTHTSQRGTRMILERNLLHRVIDVYQATSHRLCFFFFSSRRRHTRLQGDWSSDVCSSDLLVVVGEFNAGKSAFINALIGRSVLREGVTPTTAVITRVRYAASIVERREGAMLDRKSGV